MSRDVIDSTFSEVSQRPASTSRVIQHLESREVIKSLSISTPRYPLFRVCVEKSPEHLRPVGQVSGDRG